MIRGYFSMGDTSRPFVSAQLQFPELDNHPHPIELLVDTGADRTLLSPIDALRLGIDVAALESGSPGIGIGGEASTHTIDSIITLGSFSAPLNLIIVETSRPIPSLLGRDVLSHFGLFMEERTGRVLLLEPPESETIGLPQ